MLGGIAVAVAVAALWVRATSSAATPPVAAPTPMAVPATVAAARYRDLPLWWSGIGTVQPCNTVTLTPQVDGRLLRFACAEGQEIDAGALVAQIDPRTFAAQVRQARSTQARDQAQLDHARKDLAHNAEIFAQGIVTQVAIDALNATVQTAEATVAADQAALEQAELQLEFTELHAPFAGRTGLRLVDPGTIVHPGGGTGIITITQMSPIAVVFSLSQDYIPAILAAQRDGARPRVTVQTRDGAQPLADGSLESLDSAVDSATGQVRLKATFANADRALWPGALVGARILLRVEPHGLVVPSIAIQRGQAGLFVFLAAADDRVALRAVTIGEEADGVTIIRSGLEDGDRVVVQGQYRLEPGARISPRASAVATGP